MTEEAGIPDLAQALRTVADQPTIIVLDAGSAGTSYLFWSEHLTAVPWPPGASLAAGLDQIVGGNPSGGVLPGTSPTSSGWCDFTAGLLLQMDYEAPMTPPCAWQALAWAQWERDGSRSLHGPAARISAMRTTLAGTGWECDPARLVDDLVPTMNRDEHAWRIGRIQDLIAAGDIYQANLTLALRGALHPGQHRDLGAFLSLRHTSPAPFATFIRQPDRPTIISHSPECFLRARNRALTSCPIKGTRRRIHGQEAVERLALRSSTKDRAELTMIIDLVRNDLGRVAIPGTVTVTSDSALMDLDYAHHLVGIITASLAPERTYGELLASAFPAGSITGAPKHRAMQILKELETVPRGPYCGTFGWISDQGCDLAVAIRTMLIHEDGVQLHAGGGITADSQAGSEWDEVWAKASAMRRSLSTPTI